ncbi:MAG: GNAT family N-acetyltransferase [Firmicutes bacterium]|nr:GNAT family N-acetyltransferase [Bacillota bacterium]
MRFRQAQKEDLLEIEELVEQAKIHMHEEGIPQWNEFYPVREDYENDIQEGNLYVGVQDSKIVCIYTLNTYYEKEYEACTWFTDSYIVIHRLCVHPEYQNQKIGYHCMQHIIKTCAVRSIRLDVFKRNPYALNLYSHLGFKKVGEATWFGNDFFIMEKVL